MVFICFAGTRREILPGESFVLGRDRAAALQVKDPHVSRNHVRVELLPDGSTLVADLGSVNGTRVSGKLVPWAVLETGSSFTIGLSEIFLEA